MSDFESLLVQLNVFLQGENRSKAQASSCPASVEAACSDTKGGRPAEVSLAMRLAIPDLDQEGQIHQTGIGLINLLGIDLFDSVNRSLEVSDGADWLTKYRKTSLVYLNYNFNDPSNLLKELLRVSTSPLRKPIRERIEQKEIVAFFNRLQVILDDRNDWVHHNSTFSRENLKTLILNLYPVAQKLDLLMIEECDFLLSKLDGIEPDVPQVDDPIVASTTSDSVPELVKGIQEIISNSDLDVGELIENKFLDYSYALHLTGEIRNRKSNELLSELRPDFAVTLGTLMIARKPSGGRLRITSDGVVAAYFEDHWGYIATVTPEQWFPDHLIHLV